MHEEVDGIFKRRATSGITPYLTGGSSCIVYPAREIYAGKGKLEWGNKPTDGGHLILLREEVETLLNSDPQIEPLIQKFVGSQEMIQNQPRYCLWIGDDDITLAETSDEVRRRLKAVAEMRAASKASQTRPAAAYPHRFRQIQSVAKSHSFVLPTVSSENREYFPFGLQDNSTIVYASAFAMYDAPLWNLALVASKVHLVWIATVCGKLETRYRYSNTLGWNAFPIPKLTKEHKAELTRTAENILLAREAHFPATIADLYKPCLLYTSPSPRDRQKSRMPSSA